MIGTKIYENKSEQCYFFCDLCGDNLIEVYEKSFDKFDQKTGKKTRIIVKKCSNLRCPNGCDHKRQGTRVKCPTCGGVDGASM